MLYGPAYQDSLGFTSAYVSVYETGPQKAAQAEAQVMAIEMPPAPMQQWQLVEPADHNCMFCRSMGAMRSLVQFVMRLLT